MEFILSLLGFFRPLIKIVMGSAGAWYVAQQEGYELLGAIIFLIVIFYAIYKIARMTRGEKIHLSR